MKSAQERSVRYERERREASERHRRKQEQRSQLRDPERVDDKPRESEPAEHGN
jgi:hypothetical protein